MNELPGGGQIDFGAIMGLDGSIWDKSEGFPEVHRID